MILGNESHSQTGWPLRLSVDLMAADLDSARNWKPGTLKDDGRCSGTEKGFRE
jgi:hypothetical protein